MSTYPPRLASLVETLKGLDDRNERIQMLIDIAKGFRPVDEEIAERPFPEVNKVPACESEAYVWCLPDEDGTLRFAFAVENPQGISAMALAAILQKTVSGLPPEEIAAIPPDVVYEIFGTELSMGKSMGLMGMIQLVTHFARSYRGGAAENGAEKG